MAILIKTNPQQTLTSLDVRIRGPWSNADLAGETAFVWFSETQGGAGLVAQGTLSDIEQTQSDVVSISLNNIREINTRFGNQQIGLFRDSREDRPESTLAKKIYRYSHNRIVRLSDSEANFLESRIA